MKVQDSRIRWDLYNLTTFMSHSHKKQKINEDGDTIDFRKFLLLVVLLTIIFYFTSDFQESSSTNNLSPREYIQLDKLKVVDNYNLEIDENTHEFNDNIITNVFSYNNQIPGPIIFGNVGDVIPIKVKNNLDEPTTIHWHGLQIENIADGVPQVTQEPIYPGESFTYDVELRNSGLYWYHSHVDASKQVESGLQGVIMVRGENEPEVNDEAILVLDDALLGTDNQFRELHGRFGNIMLVNGKVNPDINLKGGLVRLRLVNTANARSFNLNFENELITVIGEDIGRIESYDVSTLTIHPGERYDILLKIDTEENLILSHFTSRGATSLATLNFDEPGNIMEFEDGYKFNLPFSIGDIQDRVPDLNVELSGFVNDYRELIWSINRKYFPDTTEIFNVNEGDIVKIRVKNTQGQPHPMHLHGQKFVVLSKNGILQKNLGWKDTVMIGSNEVVDIVFIAEEKGDWVFHCHILEHAEAGMLSILRVN